MTILHAIILGVIEGLTEFIPVSSSGHLRLVHTFLGVTEHDLAVDAVLQMGTIFAVLVYFRKELWSLFVTFLKLITRKDIEEKEKNLLLAVIIGTIPAVVLGLLLETYISTTFRSSYVLVIGLLCGSALLFFAERIVRTSFVSITPKKGLLLGLFQSLALVPGISRSGATISGGLFLGLSREEATRFSFLLSFPIIVGAGLKEFLDLRHVTGGISLSLGIGSCVAFIVGLLSIHVLIRYLRTHNLNIFIYYRIILAVAILLFL